MSINSEMTALADAVRSKSGVTGKLTISGMTAAVSNIVINPEGGGSGDIDLSFVTAEAGDILSGKVGADQNGDPVYGTLELDSDIDLSGVTVTAGTMLEGFVAVDKNGETITGNIKTVTAELSGNVMTVPVGYIAEEQTLTVPEASEPTTSGNVVTVNKGYVKEQKEITVGTAKAAATITPGTADQTIAAGTYLSGTQTIKGDPELIPENIKVGVEIFGVTGTFRQLVFDDLTVTPENMLEGVRAIGRDGDFVTGAIPTVTPYEKDGNIIVPAGYIANERQFSTEADGYDTSIVTATADNMLEGTIAVGKNGETITGNIPTVDIKMYWGYGQGRPDLYQIFKIEKGYVAVPEEHYVEFMPEPRIEGNSVYLQKGYFGYNGGGAEKQFSVQDAAITETSTEVTITPGYVHNELHYDLTGSIDFSGVNVTADKMLSGAVAIGADGNKVTGNIPNADITETDTEVTISPGYVSSELHYDLGGGGADLYKCASVDTATKTWSGYKAVLENGEYVFESELTEKLSYAQGLQVKKGKVYTADGKIHADKAYKHLIGYFTFNNTFEDTCGNLKITRPDNSGRPGWQILLDTSVTHWGKGTLKLNVSNAAEASIPVDNIHTLNAFTWEFWHYREQKQTPGNVEEGDDSRPVYLLNMTNGAFIAGTEQSYETLPVGRWFHHAFVHAANSNVITEYIDGVATATLDCPSNIMAGDDRVIVFSTLPIVYDFSFSTPYDRISDLAIWDNARYTENFTPPAESYKVVWEDPATIKLTGAGIEDVNGVYELTTPFATGQDRVWVKPGSAYKIAYDDNDWWSWILYDGDRYCYSGPGESENPWDGEWYDATDDESGGTGPKFILSDTEPRASAIPPGFVSNTSMFGYVINQSSSNSGAEAYKVFNQDYTTNDYGWYTGGVGVSEDNPAWFSIEVPTAFVPSGIWIMEEINSPEYFRKGVFQGSNDGEQWTDLCSIVNRVKFPGHTYEIMFTCDTAYKHFRMYFTEAYSSGISIQAFKIYKR